MLTVVTGAPFAAKGWWIASEIERREADGELGLVHLSYTGIYASLITGTESAYRDQRISDTGAARFAAYLLAVALREARTRELAGYAAVDSPRRALAGRAGYRRRSGSRGGGVPQAGGAQARHSSMSN